MSIILSIRIICLCLGAINMQEIMKNMSLQWFDTFGPKKGFPSSSLNQYRKQTNHK